MYPAHKSDPKAAADWNYDTFLKAAEACHKAGYPFGLGLGQTGDSVNNTGIIYSAFGAELVNAKGEITVDSDAVNAAAGLRPQARQVPAARTPSATTMRPTTAR